MIHRIMTWCAGYVLVRLPGSAGRALCQYLPGKGDCLVGTSVAAGSADGVWISSQK